MLSGHALTAWGYRKPEGNCSRRCLQASYTPRPCEPVKCTGAELLGFQREPREIGIRVVVVLVFSSFHERHDAIGRGRSDDFPTASQSVLCEHHRSEMRL